MAMPSTEEYAKAVQEPKNLALPLLRAMRLVRDPNKDNAPRMWKGAFGVVFRFEQDEGNGRAIKCFTRMHRSHAERYSAISDHLDKVFFYKAPLARFLINWLYVPRGIRVGKEHHPLLLMDWVDGAFIDDHLAALAEKPDAGAQIAALTEQWTTLALSLKNAGVVHGDLQHGNILVLPSGDLKLIDYDGMFVPALSNRFMLEGGHLNYQHPGRSLRSHENLDAFSALTILTALTALSIKPELWTQYYRGNNILFHESDFRDPVASLLFNELSRISDPRLSYLINELRRVCMTQDTASMKSFDEIIAPLQGH